MAIETTDSFSSKISKRRSLDDNSNILKGLIRELPSDTTRISEIGKKKVFIENLYEKLNFF